MATVDIAVTDGVEVEVDVVRADAEAILVQLERAEAELSVLLTDDPTIHTLNRQWRGVDRPTDVLSFSQLEGEPLPGDEDVLGDVVISVPTARRQGEQRGHDLATELRVLLVHGICHLLGHDHEQDDQAEVMEALERRVLQAMVT